MMQEVYVNLYPGLPWQKRHSKKKKLTSRLDLDLRKKLVKFYIWSVAVFAVLKIGHFGK